MTINKGPAEQTAKEMIAAYMEIKAQLNEQFELARVNGEQARAEALKTLIESVIPEELAFWHKQDGG